VNVRDLAGTGTWPCQQEGLHTGNTARALPIEGRRWVGSTSNIREDPHVGLVYVAAEDGKLYALNATTGRALFRGSVAGGGRGRVLASPTVDGGNVFVSAYDQSTVTAFALRAQ
jgi:outer membrane protein assembly factor BamB